MWGQSLYQENLAALLLTDWRFQNLESYVLYLSQMNMIMYAYVGWLEMIAPESDDCGREAIEKMHLILLSRSTTHLTLPILQ